MVEQFGMRRLLADVAEVVDRADEARSKQMVPDAMTITRAVNGLPALAIRSASSNRPLPSTTNESRDAESTSRYRRDAISPGRMQSPRTKTGCSKLLPDSANPRSNAR